MTKRKAESDDDVNGEENTNKELKISPDDEDLSANNDQEIEQKPESVDVATDKSPTVKICSWNVAGLKACVKKNLVDYICKEDADIVCLQETKCLEKDVPGEVLKLKVNASSVNSFFNKADGKPSENSPSYHMFWNVAEKKGYAGVALWSKVKPLEVKYGMGIKEHDNEGRLLTAEFEKYFVVTTYVPNSGRKLVRLDYRMTWDEALKTYLNELNSKKPVIYCGDLNVAHNEIDLANPKSNRRNAGFTQEERDSFSLQLAEGYFDSFRHLHPDQRDIYTFWTYMANARVKNVGWRLDYFILSNALEEKLCDNEVRSDVMGSDHCPIVLSMAL